MTQFINNKRSLLFQKEKDYVIFKKINIYFAMLVSFLPLVSSILNFSIFSFILYLLCALFLTLPSLLERCFHVIILEEVRFITIFHIMLHNILGKTFQFYIHYPYYDSYLHLLGGGWLALTIFPILFSIESKDIFSLSKYFKIKISLYTLSFTNLLGVLWEIGEFIYDLILVNHKGYLPAQESLFDTMKDLIQNNIGAIFAIFFVWKFIQYKNKKSESIIRVLKNIT